MSRRHNVRRIKAHRNYTSDELARTLGVCITTVRRWKAEGLHPIDGARPFLFAACEIVAFLRHKEKPRQPLLPGQIFCVACKAAKQPLGNAVDLKPHSETSATLVGVCPDCRHGIHRHVKLGELVEKAGNVTVRYESEKVPIASDRNALRAARFEESLS